MKRPPKAWKQTDLAMLIGLRALGNDFDFIADRLDCSPGEARGMLQAARTQLESGYWVERLLTQEEPAPRHGVEKIDPAGGKARRFRVSPHIKEIQAAYSADVTVRLMGDPEPGRSANPSSKEL